MAVKTPFTHDDFVHIFSLYDLGQYTGSEAAQQGTIQTNFFVLMDCVWYFSRGSVNDFFEKRKIDALTR